MYSRCLQRQGVATHPMSYTLIFMAVGFTLGVSSSRGGADTHINQSSSSSSSSSTCARLIVLQPVGAGGANYRVIAAFKKQCDHSNLVVDKNANGKNRLTAGDRDPPLCPYSLSPPFHTRTGRLKRAKYM
jgi:hypothetical protein